MMKRDECFKALAGHVSNEVVVATEQPYGQVVATAIRELRLDLHVVLNKGAVMVLPGGISKATGLDVALAELGLSARDVVGVGDAENDLAFLERCGLSAAVANALPALRQRADLVTEHGHGRGVAELVDAMLRDDLPDAGAVRGGVPPGARG